MAATKNLTRILIILVALLISGSGTYAQTRFTIADLDDAFRGAQLVDLRTSKVPSVVTLREQVKIPPPSEPVKVKMFTRDKLPAVLRPAFAKKGVMGITIQGRYVAIIRTEIEDEYKDTLGHELVHAYVTLVSPKPLPFWFQEGGAVKLSMGKASKFYGQPSDTEAGVTVGRVVEVAPTYKQKLQSFNYMIESAGKEKFYDWYRNAVVTGVVDPSTLIEPGEAAAPRREFRKPMPIWLWPVAGAVVVGILVIGFYSSRKDRGYY